MICSWEAAMFDEQAKATTENFNQILVTFDELEFGFRTIISSFKKMKINITKKITNTGLTMYSVSYPKVWFCGSRINEIIKEKAAFRLIKFLKDKHIEISLIHAQSIFYAGFWTYRIHKLFEIPFVLTIQNQVNFVNKSNLEYETVRKILNESSFNFICSNDKIRQLATNGIYSEYVNVGNLISNQFNYTKRIDNKILKIITISSFHPCKDQGTIFEAFKIIDKKLTKKIDFEWIGLNGWQKNNPSEISDFLKKYKLNKITIKTTPFLDRIEISKKLKNADLFVFSSIIEGMPISVLEALACGLPVFTTNCGGTDEIISEYNGKIFQIKDSQQLATYIENFISNKYHFNKEKISFDILNKYGTIPFNKRISKYYQKAIDDSRY